MNFITTLLGTLERVVDETESPGVDHRDLLFEKNIRKVFKGMDDATVNGRRVDVPRAKCVIEGTTIKVRPRDVTRFLYDCKRYGIDTHPAAQELNSRFAREPDFYLEFRHDG